MKEVKNPVMCRAIEPLVMVTEERNLPTDPLIKGMPFEWDYLKNPKNRIEFGQFATLCERWEALLGGEDEFIEVVLKSNMSDDRPLLSIVRFAKYLADPMIVYKLYERFAGPAMFPCMKSDFTKIGHRTLQIDIWTPEDDNHSKHVFLVTGELMRRLPMAIGAKAATVTPTIEKNHGTFIVQVPISISIWTRVARVFRVLFSADWLERELTLQNDIMIEAVDELKTTYRQLEDKSRKLETSQKRFSLAVSGARDGIWDWDLTSNEIYFSEQWFEICGYDPAYHVLDSLEDWLERIHFEERKSVERAISAHVAGETDELDEQYRIVLPNREVRWVHAKGKAIRNADGDAERMAGSLSDITTLIETLHTLDVTEQSYRAVIEHSPDATMLYSENGILEVNPAMEAFVGYSNEELIGKPVFKVTDQHTAFFPPEISNLRGAYEVRFISKSGEIVHGEVSAIRVLYEGGYSYCAMIRDVSEKRRLLERAKEMDRMIAVGTMASGVAHEINNPMAYIHSNTEFVLDTLRRLNERVKRGIEVSGEDLQMTLDDVNAALGDVIEGSIRVRDIVSDLKSFSYSAEKEKPSPVDVIPIIQSAVNMANHETSGRCKIETRFQRTPAVAFNETRLSQIILNLLINAAHAIEPGDPENNLIRVSTRCNAKDVFIEISDTGVGIPEKLRDKIFDPFFTTKPAGHGTGLGLSICFNIVRRFGGDLNFESTLGEGTTFRIRLPRMEESLEWDSSSKEISEAMPDYHIMIIDDDEKIGVMMRRVLGQDYHVTFVNDSEQAMDTFEELGDVDLIVSDAMMPNISGYELLEVMEKKYPSMLSRFILMTGGRLETAKFEKFEKSYGVPVTFKPFDIEELKTLVAETLAKAEPPSSLSAKGAE